MKRLLLLPLAFFLALSFPAQAQTTRSGTAQMMSGFGRALAVSDGLVYVGEPANPHQPGVVYVYHRPDAEWTRQAQLSASDGAVEDGFGSALAVDGSTLLVGAPQKDDSRGAAYVFRRNDMRNWSEVAPLAFPDTAQGSRFGGSVALSGSMALIGAPRVDEQGAVYVFRQDANGTWSQLTKLAFPDTTTGARFGASLAFDGTRALISAPRANSGVVYVFHYDENTDEWTQEAELSSDEVSSGTRFGSTLSFNGNVALIGAPRHNNGTGAVFRFRRNASSGTWAPTGKLAAFDGSQGDGFGASLAFDGTEAWIGAPGASHRMGALYLFERDPAAEAWTGARKVTGPTTKQGDRFAGTVAAAGDVAVVGLTGADYGAGTAAILERDAAANAWTLQTTVLSESSSVLQPITGNKVKCSDGNVAQFGCENVDLLSFLPIDKIGGKRGVQVNDIWGWTDPETSKEYALVGRMDGTSFVDVSNPTNPVYVGNLPKTDSAQASIWRDIKVYKNHAYVVSDNAGQHGMQIFDLTQLRDFDGTPLTFEETAHYDKIHSAHNVVINTDTGFAYIVGSSGGGQTCGGGLHMVNIQDPTNPTFAGCFADPSTGRSGTGYTHDAQCVTYNGPDTQYQGREICIGSNETAISIADVTDKENPKAISTASYPDHAYVHQGWLTEDQRYFFQNDELDEINGSVDHTRTLVWDVTDLDDPQLVRQFMLSNPSTDHNLYIKNGTMYESNYVSGLRVLDVSDPENPVEVGYFDTEPFGKDAPGFAGTWSNYPFFQSGIVIMTSMQEGLFILKKQKPDV